MARRAEAMPAGARRPEPLFTVLVGYESFAGPICELADGTVVAPGSLMRWLDQSWVERVVFDGPNRIKNVQPRAAGGLTTETNGRVACGFHNRERHRQRERPP